MSMFYYQNYSNPNSTHFQWNYTEQDQCEVVGGLNYNWCMTESRAMATYRGFSELGLGAGEGKKRGRGGRGGGGGQIW